MFAFEPSPRERRALLRHVRINRCRNVSIEALALGGEEGNASLFVVQGEQTGCNSLRTPAPDVPGEFIPTPVHIVRLDDWLDAQKIERVDFIKLDVEGGELEVLRGAEDLLKRRPRLLILAELQDVRAKSLGPPSQGRCRISRKSRFSLVQAHAGRKLGKCSWRSGRIRRQSCGCSRRADAGDRGDD